MSTTSIGQFAEGRVATQLEHLGYTILDRNWRTRYCEIDIIAQRKQRLYFVEVKYRQTTRQGSGLDYITPKKQEQMRFAAELWVYQQSWKHDYVLCAVEVTGSEFIVGEITEIEGD